MQRGLVLAGVATIVLVTLLPATAGARTVHEDLAAAQAFWGSDVCAGQWQVTPDKPEQRSVRGGAATGLVFAYNPGGGTYTDERGDRWDWRIERCEFTVNPELQGCDRFRVVLHEIGHFLHGPGHDGPMSPEVLGQAPCPIQEVAAVAAAAPPPSQGKVARRSRAQIARSLRYKRTRARIRARAASCRRSTSRGRHSYSVCRPREQSVQPTSGGRGA